MRVRSFLYITFFASTTLLLSASNIAAQGTWAKESSNGFYERRDLSSCAIDGKIYVLGGTPIDTLQVFDPVTHIWSTPSTTGTYTHGYAQSASVFDGKIYVFGGGATGFVGTVDVFDPASNNWSTLVTTGAFIPRWYHTSCTVGNKIYVMGGDNSDFSRPPLSDLQVFDPLTNSWSTPVTTGRFTPRYGLTSNEISGKIYVLGGDTDNIGISCNFLEVFDPSTNTWSTPSTTGTFSPRGLLTSSVVASKIYVMGGQGPSQISIAPLNTLEVFDPRTNVWSTPVTSGTFTARQELSSSVLNGKIYVLGGYTPHQELNTVEVFTPGPSSVSNSPPSSYSLFENYPNPFNIFTTITYTLAQRGSVTLEIFDMLGRKIQTLVSGLMDAGSLSARFDAANLPSGIYTAQITAGSLHREMKMILGK